MKLFQVAGFGPHYLNYFNEKHKSHLNVNFEARRMALLADRYDATHILAPVYDQPENSFFTVGDDPFLQRAWAHENGLSWTNQTDILLAQIEESKADIVYQLDPVRFPSSFVRRMPGCVKKTIAWRASVVGEDDFSAYDIVLSNFSSLNRIMERRGVRTGYFAPSYDPVMYSYSENFERPTDIFFTGSFVRNGHGPRLEILNALAKLDKEVRLDFRLLTKKWGRLSASGLARFIPAPNFIPRSLKGVVASPIFGLDMYEALSRSKIVINPATDVAGDVRGNMRCWEALGCGACMMGTAGSYPDGFIPGENFESFKDTEDLIKKIKSLLEDESRLSYLAMNGVRMLSTRWSKERQWRDFIKIVESL